MSELLIDFMSRETAAKPSIIGRGILPVESKMILGGAAKANKSFLILNIGLAIAQGTPLFNAYYPNRTPVFPVTKPHRVLLIEQEVGESGLRQRLASILEAKPEWSITPFFIKSRDMQLNLDSQAGIDAISREIEAVEPSVLILDPLSKMHSRDENSAQEMGMVMRSGDKWIQQFGVSVIYVHHTGLAALDPLNGRKGGARLRGSSAVFADTDTMLEIQRKGSASDPQPVLELNFELRQGEPLDVQWVRRMKSGLVVYVGEGVAGLSNSNRGVG